MANENIKELFQESIALKQKIVDGDYLDVLSEMGEVASSAIAAGNKLLFCGNGGSAADAQHLAAEMLIRLRSKYNRASIPALSLAQDTSTITACGNDYSYDDLFARLLQSLGKENDVLIGVTTSGTSTNVVKAMKEAKKMGITVFGFLGNGGGTALEQCDLAFVVPDDNTGRVQEAHITAGHALMEAIEDQLIKTGYIELEN